MHYIIKTLYTNIQFKLTYVMHLLIKWYYWYKNLGDELIIFSLLNWADERFNPERISIECWDVKRLENWIIKQKAFLIPWIIEKLNFLPKPNRKEKIKLCLWLKKNTYDYIILWWWEVVDESRSLIYRWRNLYLQYRWDIEQWHCAIVWWLWTSKKLWTNYLQRFLIKNSSIIILRDKNSFDFTKKILQEIWQNRENKAEYDWDLTLPLLEETKKVFAEEKVKTKRDSYYLVNFSPLCNKEESFKKIKKFSDSHKNSQPIYVACSKDEDEKYFKDIQEILPNCEFFNRSLSNVVEILKLFYFSEWWIWARLHFLYILKFFNKEYVQLHNSYKIESNLSDLDNNNA